MKDSLNIGTLRDWFAGMALQGLLSVSRDFSPYPPQSSDLAKAAYAMADAMMEAREAKK